MTAEVGSFAGALVMCPPSAVDDRWSRRLPDPVTAFASGWMRIRGRVRQAGVELPLVISDHADWPELLDTIVETGAEDVWVTHGRDDALVYQLGLMGRKARALSLVGFGTTRKSKAADEAIRQPARLPDDDAIAQRQDRAARLLFSRGARSRPRLGAWRADRWSVSLPPAAACAGRDHGREDRSDALSAVARLRRRYRRDGLAAVAGQAQERSRRL